MSYILEALRKSEQERNRGTTPDITTLHDGPPDQLVTGARPSRLPWFVGGALVLNAIVLAVWLLRPTDETSAAPTPPPAAEPAAPPARLPAATPAPTVAAEVVQAPSPRPVTAAPREAPAVAPEPADVAPAAVAADAAAARAPATEETAAAAPAPDRTAPDPVAPVAIRELPDRVQRRIPQLDFATHIYGDEPRYREVTINGRRYAEGERVEGMLLSEITETGVVFDFEGFRFEVSVLEDWDY